MPWEDALYAIGSVWVNPNGNRNVPYLNNWNDKRKRKLNLNWYDNEWNRNYRFAAVRNFLLMVEAPVLFGGSFVYELSSPAAEHFTNFNERWGYGEIFPVVEHLHFPREL